VTPGLAVVLVGDNPASQVYVRNKVKACHDAGLHSVLEKYPADLSEAELLARVEALNNDPAIHGILVQLPLPAHIDAQKVIEAISPAKDVDGFHIASAGALMTGMPGFWPCTPYGCMKMLESIGYDLRGKHAVVIGRSNIVGKPMALMLLAGRHRHRLPQRTKDLKAPDAAGRRDRRRRGQAQRADGRHGQARRRGAGRGHEPQRRRQALRRRGLRRRKNRGQPHHPRTRRRGPHDHHHAAGQHPGSRRTRGGLIATIHKFHGPAP
jgi:hypothetical protein